MVVLDTVILSGQHHNMDILGTVLIVESEAAKVVVEEVVVDEIWLSRWKDLERASKKSV